MKKCVLSVLFIAAVLGCVLKAEDVKVKTDSPAAYFNLGSIIGVSDESLSFLPYGGFNLDYPLGKNMMISPELNLILGSYVPVYFAPGVQINIKGNSMFLGGGIVLLTDFSHHQNSMFFKLNAGCIGAGTKIGVYLLTRKGMDGAVILGVTASFRLGKKK